MLKRNKMIKKIICPNLNITNMNQAFVKFDDEFENPIGIMCRNYQQERCTTAKEDNIDKKCIYSFWKPSDGATGDDGL